MLSHWQIYILRTASGTLYTGISTDISRRLHQHACGKGAKSLRGKAPLQLVYQSCPLNQSEALRLEYQVKQLRRVNKLKLIQQQPSNLTNWLNQAN